jgi:hypothetical protein
LLSRQKRRKEMSNEEWIDDEDLLMEAARYAVKIKCDHNKFMSLAKRAWFQSASEAGVNPQTHGIKLRRRGVAERRFTRDRRA